MAVSSFVASDSESVSSVASLSFGSQNSKNKFENLSS